MRIRLPRVESLRPPIRLALEVLERLRLVDSAVERSRLTGLPLHRIASSIVAFDFLYLEAPGRRGSWPRASVRRPWSWSLSLAGTSSRRNAIKILMNSFYGVLGTPACRFSDPRLANAIAGFGRGLWALRALLPSPRRPTRSRRRPVHAARRAGDRGREAAWLLSLVLETPHRRRVAPGPGQPASRASGPTTRPWSDLRFDSNPKIPPKSRPSSSLSP